MTRRRRILSTCWLVVQLLLGQQLALAHVIGHAANGELRAIAALEASAHGEDADPDPAHPVSHACSTCVGCLGFDLALGGVPCTHTPGALPRTPVAPAVLRASPLRQLVLPLIRAPPSLSS